MSTDIDYSLNSAKETRKTSNIFAVSFVVSNEETWLALLPWVSKNPDIYQS